MFSYYLLYIIRAYVDMVELSYEMLSFISVIILTAFVFNGVGQPKIDTFKEKPDRCYDTDELARYITTVQPTTEEDLPIVADERISLTSSHNIFTTDVNGKIVDVYDNVTCRVKKRRKERRCCMFPPFFDQLSARACGALVHHISTDDRFNITHIRRDMFGRTDYWRCILTKYKLLDDEDKLVHDKYYSHLDKWASLNPEFSTVITTAKMFCLNLYRYEMPLEISGFFEFQKCIRNYVKLDCPVIIQSQECLEWKEFYDECREFYI